MSTTIHLHFGEIIVNYFVLNSKVQSCNPIYVIQLMLVAVI